MLTNECNLTIGCCTDRHLIRTTVSSNVDSLMRSNHPGMCPSIECLGKIRSGIKVLCCIWSRFNLYMLGLFAAVALIFAVTGLFGVMAYLVSQRTREIAVRLALGATQATVFRTVIGRGIALAAGGAVRRGR